MKLVCTSLLAFFTVAFGLQEATALPSVHVENTAGSSFEKVRMSYHLPSGTKVDRGKTYFMYCPVTVSEFTIGNGETQTIAQSVEADPRRCSGQAIDDVQTLEIDGLLKGGRGCSAEYPSSSSGYTGIRNMECGIFFPDVFEASFKEGVLVSLTFKKKEKPERPQRR